MANICKNKQLLAIYALLIKDKKKVKILITEKINLLKTNTAKDLIKCMVKHYWNHLIFYRTVILNLYPSLKKTNIVKKKHLFAYLTWINKELNKEPTYKKSISIINKSIIRKEISNVIIEFIQTFGNSKICNSLLASST